MPPTKATKKHGTTYSGPCPNPNCTSRGRHFPNLGKHIGQKPECMDFMQSLRQKVFDKHVAMETKYQAHAQMPTTATAGTVATTSLDEEDGVAVLAMDLDDPAFYTEPHDDNFPISDDNDDDNGPATHNLSDTDDLLEMHLNQYTEEDVNADDYLINPDPVMFTNARRIEVTLLKILTELDTPLWAFKVIMDWALDAMQSGYNFIPHQQTYQGQLTTVAKWVGLDHLKPITVNVPLPGERADDKVPVTTFDFVGQVLSLLSDRELNTLDKLVVNRDDPFTRYEPPDGRVGESLSGSWYRNAWTHMEESTNCTFMIPIILYIDETKMAVNGRMSLFPVQMSLAIFTEETRRSSRAWRPLGYIANEEYFFSPAELKVNDTGVKSERFHRQLEAILKSFKRAQAPGALSNIPLQLGPHVKNVNLYVPLQFIIGDVKGGDQLASRVDYRQKACTRLCRTCDVSTLNAGNTNLRCNRIRQAHIQTHIANQSLAELKKLDQHPGFNALYSIDCGNDPYGVFSMIHTEGLHAIEVGLIPYMLEILLNDIPNSRHNELDTLVKRLLRHPRQHGYQAFPRMLWNDGVTTITLLTGQQKVGKMFAITVTALTDEGCDFFSDVLKGGRETWRKMVYVYQQILCYWHWLKKDTYWMVNDTVACAEATRSIKTMMRQLQALWPRQDGLMWNLTKLHEQFHVPEDIHRIGKHRNVHSGPQEHNHIDLKHAARKTQLNKKKLDHQTGLRVLERLVIQRAYDFVKTDVRTVTKDRPPPDPLLNGSKATFRFTTDPGRGPDVIQVEYTWHSQCNFGAVPMYQAEIAALLLSELFPEYAGGVSTTIHNSRCALVH